MTGPAPKPIQVVVRVPQPYLDIVDNICERVGKSKTALFRQCFEEWVSNQPALKKESEALSVIAADIKNNRAYRKGKSSD